MRSKMSGLDGLYLRALKNWINYFWSLCKQSYALRQKRSISTTSLKIVYFISSVWYAGLEASLFLGFNRFWKPSLGNWYMFNDRRYAFIWDCNPSQMTPFRMTVYFERPDFFENNPTYCNMFMSSRDWRTETGCIWNASWTQILDPHFSGLI